jgi:colicin import membrane protein
MKPVTAGGPYRVPPEPRRWPAITLAVAVHALLLAFLWFGIDWQNNEPVQVEAEVWDMKVQAAAPAPPPPEEAEPQPEPQPAPKVVEKQAEQPVAPPPDIKLEREKKRKEQLKKEQEQREEREAEKAREEARAKELAEKKEAEKQQKLDEKKEAEKKAAADKKKAEKLAKAKAAEDDKKLAKLRAESMKSIVGAAGATGSAAKATAPRSDTGYLASITSKIKSTTTYAGSTDVPGNPKVTFRVEQLPTGEILSVKKIKSSGVAAFDDAVEKGIIKSSPLPKKKDGTVERSLVVDFSMKDLD